MEAFGAVVNICSFIDLSAKVITKLNKYIAEVKSADKSRQRFAEELHRIVVILKAFESLVNQLHQQASSQSESQVEALTSFFKNISPQTQNLYEELVSLSEWLDEETKVQREMGFLQRMKWPSNGRKIETMLLELSRHIETFSLALAVDSR